MSTKKLSSQRTTLEAGKPSPTSPSNALLLSPTISPTSPSFIGTNERERHPWLAPSADSAGSWEGASDIYDDYRYSRFSMASKMSMSSRFSVNAASGVAPTPPVPESRPSTDSNSSRPQVDSTRSRGGIHSAQERILQSRGRIHLPHSLLQVLEGDGTMEENKRTMSMDSEASVYTQNSISSIAPLSLPATKATSRPVPLNLTQQSSPLLHTSLESSSGLSSSAVGSGFVYPASSKSSSMAYTSAPGVVHEGTADVGHVLPALLITLEFKTKARAWIRLKTRQDSITVSSSRMKTSFPRVFLTVRSTTHILLLPYVHRRLLARRRLQFRCTCVTLIGIFRRHRRLNLSSSAGWLFTNTASNADITRCFF
jgi:hypothetical protein